VKAVFLKKKEDKRIRNGHLWVFSNEIEKTTGNPNNGDMVVVFDSKEEQLGTGFYNKNSLIAVRMISKSNIDNLSELFRKRICNAFNLRKIFYPNRESFRMVFGESDYLPGLIIDKFNNTFILQVNSYGIQSHLELILEILKTDFNAENIFTKHDFYLRKLEGFPEEDSVYLGIAGTEVIDDGLIKYKIDFNQSQKTGFYFDQNDNRFFIEKIAPGKTVADVFSNCGGFGLHAIQAGAKSVDFIDSSSLEIESVKKNILLNNLNADSKFYVKDAFDFLAEKISENKKYDVVMLDPPAFAKSKKNLPAAEKGYEKLNKLALQIINDDGYLVTSSCSYHLKGDVFLKCINNAAVKSKKNLQLLKFDGASLDHPKLASMEETSYLKFAVFKVLGD
jgi:23S rRNA (cytosine1962-C5)-methyltransferase